LRSAWSSSTPEPEVGFEPTACCDGSDPGRFHAVLPVEWTIIDVFGGVSVYATVRAIEAARAREDLGRRLAEGGSADAELA
jgi:hypothetical protein